MLRSYVIIAWRNIQRNKTLVVVLDLTKVPDTNPVRNVSFKNELKLLSTVDKVTLTNAVPGKPGWVGQWAHAAEKSADETIGVEFKASASNPAEALRSE